MKTKNKIRKTAFVALLACGLIILDFSVNAQFTTSLNVGKETAMIAMTLGSNEYGKLFTSNNSGYSEYANAFAGYLTVETEESFELEDWMYKESSFEVADANSDHTEDFSENTDGKANEHGSHVSGENDHRSRTTKLYFNNELNVEEKLKIEGWMLDPKIWNN